MSGHGDDRPPKGPPSRRAGFRPDIRAALALEEAGDLEEAARVLECAGEHAQAAGLRLEHANTIRDQELRIGVLREGCARNPGNSEEGRALHIALAEALLARVEHGLDPVKNRSLQTEAARALEEGGEALRAGELYETLGLLSRAAAAYEAAGAVARLELVLEILERRDRIEAEMRALDDRIDRAIREGRRREARDLLEEHVRHRQRDGRAPHPSLAGRLESLKTRRPRIDRIDLAIGGRTLRVCWGDRLVIGRAPDCQVVLTAPALSRHHVELRVTQSAGRPAVVAVDLGSRAGTFWDRDPLGAGVAVPLLRAGTLGLGVAAVLRVDPIPVVGRAVPGVLLSAADSRTLFCPGGGPLPLGPASALPAEISIIADEPVLVVDGATMTSLAGEPLGCGAEVDLLIGDLIELESDVIGRVTIEVLA